MDFCHLLKELNSDFKTALTGKLEIPFLDAIYQFLADSIYKSKEHTKEELTFAKAIAFIIAIPYTFINKIINGEAPFKNDTYRIERPDFFKESFVVQKSSFVAAGGLSAGVYYSTIGGAIAYLASIPENLIAM